MATNGKRNRSAGHDFEKKVAETLRNIGFPFVVTTRSESRSRDGEGVDLINKGEVKNGRLPYNFSLKNHCKYPRYHTLLRDMPKDAGINVILHKFTVKKGMNFHPVGHYAILNMEDFLKLIQRIQELEKLKI